MEQVFAHVAKTNDQLAYEKQAMEQKSKYEQRANLRDQLQNQIKNNSIRTMGKRDLNYAMFNGMNERER